MPISPSFKIATILDSLSFDFFISKILRLYNSSENSTFDWFYFKGGLPWQKNSILWSEARTHDPINSFQPDPSAVARLYHSRAKKIILPVYDRHL